MGAIALSYPPRVRVRTTVKHSAAFFHDESSITIEGVRKCNSAEYFYPPRPQGQKVHIKYFLWQYKRKGRREKVPMKSLFFIE